MSFLLGCIILTLKVTIGSLVIAVGLLFVGIIGGLILTLIQILMDMK